VVRHGGVHRRIFMLSRAQDAGRTIIIFPVGRVESPLSHATGVPAASITHVIYGTMASPSERFKGEVMSIKLAVPNKGRLNERSIEILKQAGLEIENGGERKLSATVKNGDLSIMFLRAQDIVGFVHKGAVDMGITGWDLVLESGQEVHKLLDMGFGRCRLSVAVPEDQGVETVEDIPEGSIVATSFPQVARRYFEDRGKRVDITVITGAAEVTPHLGVANLIVDLVSSGSTLKTNRLKEIAVIAESQAVLVASNEAMQAKRVEVEELASAIKSVLDAEGKRYLMADVPVSSLDEVRTFLPGIAGPTVMNIVGRDDVVAIHVVVDKSAIYGAVNKLKRLGATGILIVPIDRMVP
jgi:ATP phosphoribosyltransferase